MTIRETKNGDTLQLDVDGRIDSLSCQDFQNEILKAFQKTKSLYINMEQVSYISSAGLRALLIGQKTAQSKGGSLVITNCAENVLDVFRVTGFNSLLDIR